jgi:hypothetical protein
MDNEFYFTVAAPFKAAMGLLAVGRCDKVIP